MPAQEVQCGQPGLRPEAAFARGTAMVLQPPKAGRRPPLHHPCTHTTPQRTRRVELGVAAVQVHAVDGPIHKLGRARILLVHRLRAGVARSACATPARCGALSEDGDAPCQAPDVRGAESLQGGCGSCGGGVWGAGRASVGLAGRRLTDCDVQFLVGADADVPPAVLRGRRQRVQYQQRLAVKGLRVQVRASRWQLGPHPAGGAAARLGPAADSAGGGRWVGAGHGRGAQPAAPGPCSRVHGGRRTLFASA
jgi:hypothetical protein